MVMNNARQTLSRTCLVSLVFLFISTASLTDSVRAGGVINTTGGGTAIDGYDPVAYFTMGRARYGSKDITYEWLGAKWRFVNAEHRELFISDPFKYLPQHGGYCSSAARSGETDSVDPKAWKIVNGKLYLFYSSRSKHKFRADDPRSVQADIRWEKVKAGLQ